MDRPYQTVIRVHSVSMIKSGLKCTWINMQQTYKADISWTKKVAGKGVKSTIIFAVACVLSHIPVYR